MLVASIDFAFKGFSLFLGLPHTHYEWKFFLSKIEMTGILELFDAIYGLISSLLSSSFHEQQTSLYSILENFKKGLSFLIS